MAESNPAVETDGILADKSEPLELQKELELENTQVLLTLPSQPEQHEENIEDQTQVSHESEKSPDLFRGAVGMAVDSQEKYKENSAPSVVAKEGSTTKHPMITRSKTNLPLRENVSLRSKPIFRGGSLRSLRSKSTVRSMTSVLSDSQLKSLYQTKKLNQHKRVAMEEQQTQHRLTQEAIAWEESNKLQDVELEQEWQDLLRKEEEEAEEFKRQQEAKQQELKRQEQELKHQEEELKRQQEAKQQELKRQEQELKRQQEVKKQTLSRKMAELRQKRDHERQGFQKRIQRDVEELRYRSEREQLQLDTEYSEALAERGLAGVTLPATNIVQSEQAVGTAFPTININATQIGSETSDTAVNAQNSTLVLRSVPADTAQQNNPSGIAHAADLNPGILGNSLTPSLQICCPQDTGAIAVGVPVFNSGLSKMGASAACTTAVVSLNSNHSLSVMSNQILNRNESSLNSFQSPLYQTRMNTSPECLSNATIPNTTTCCSAPRVTSVVATSNPIISGQNDIVPNQGPTPQVIYVTQSTGLPPPEPPIFQGDAGEFQNFIDIFQTIICCKVQNPKQRFIYLLQYTRGSAHALVKGCQHRGALCFDEAVNLLEENYGQKFQVGPACINSVSLGPQLKLSDRESLTTFYAELTSCVNTLEGINYSGLSLMTIDKIAARMPPGWRNGWLSLVDDVLNEQKKELTLRHLSKYVRKKTREVSNIPPNDPNPSSKVLNPVKGLKPYKSMFAATVEKTEQGCARCNEAHFLNQCPQFRAMRYEEREKFVKESGFCFSCLKHGHWAKNCNREKPCLKFNCNKRHTTLLHPPDKRVAVKGASPIANNPMPPQNQNLNEAKPETKVSAFMNSSDEDRVLLNVIPVKVRVAGSKHPIVTNAFFDSGSTSSFVSESLMQKLHVDGPKTDLNIRTILDCSEHTQSSIVSGIELSDFDESQFVALSQLFSSKKIDIDKSNIPTQKDVDQFAEFNKIVIPQINNFDIGLLIGKDNSKLHKPLEVVYGPRDHFAVKTLAGWMISCPPINRSTCNRKSCFFVKPDVHPLCQMCTEVIDSTQNEKTELSPNQELFLERMNESIRLREDSHYEMCLPFFDPAVQVPFNRAQAVKRADHLKRRFLGEPDFYSEYKSFVQDMILLGYAEKVSQLAGPEGRTWYLSHHDVFHPEKKSLRVVHDCLAKFHETTLNDLLLQGPDLTSNLVGVFERSIRTAKNI